MRIGDKVQTPRFGMVTVDKVFESKMEAVLEGYREPTHYHDGQYAIYGKHEDTNQNGWVRFSFAAVSEAS